MKCHSIFMLTFIFRVFKTLRKIIWFQFDFSRQMGVLEELVHTCLPQTKGHTFYVALYRANFLLICRCESLVCQLDPKGHTFYVALFWAKFLFIYSCEGLVCVTFQLAFQNIFSTYEFVNICKPVIRKIHFTCCLRSSTSLEMQTRKSLIRVIHAL